MSVFAPGAIGRRGRLVTAGVVVAGTVLIGPLAPMVAQAAVPAFPDNITVFPDRDFVSIDGFAEHAGQQITIEVRRPGAGLVGSAIGTTASAASIAAGNPAIEVNHPGGICWGAGGGLQVTPDIRAGDVISLKFGGLVVADTTTLDAAVTGGTLTSPTTLVVEGRIGPAVDPAFIEQRIVEPALRNTDVGRRDARAVPGGMVVAPKGGYSSGLQVGGGTFTATYEFLKAETAAIAAGGQFRAMSWQDQDANGNRQGVTIAEFGELGGPGMGGCPAGPLQQGPASPTNVTAVGTGNSTDITWTPAVATPGSAPILGYTVRAVDQFSSQGAQAEVGRRLSNPDASSATLPTTLAGKRVEVRAFSESGESWPPALPGNTPSGDVTRPTVQAAPAGGLYTTDVSVALSANEAGSEIYYTLDGSDPLEAGTAGPAATLATGPIAISSSSGPVTLRYVAFDPAGNASLTKLERYTFGAVQVPGAPQSVTAQPANGMANVRWSAPLDAGTSPITGYQVTATPTTGTPIVLTAGPSATTVQVNGLVNGTAYGVTVVAVSAAGSSNPSSTVTVTPVAPAIDTLTVTSAKWKSGDLRLKGTGNIAGASLTFRSGSATGTVFATAVIVQPPAAGALNGTWSLRVRAGSAATRNPSPVFISSDKDGTLGPLTVPNR
ncbi:MAG TPA: fibronectin type III domain-containing protein [Kribbella sp.]